MVIQTTKHQIARQRAIDIALQEAIKEADEKKVGAMHEESKDTTVIAHSHASHGDDCANEPEAELMEDIKRRCMLVNI